MRYSLNHNLIKPAFLKRNWKIVVAVLMLLLAIVFFRSERKELTSIGPYLSKANPIWLLIALVLSLIYFLIQGRMYRQCFAAVGLRLPWLIGVDLFLKRNFISVFLPAGGISSLAYSPSQIRKAGYAMPQVHQASGLYSLIGLVSVFLVGLPVVAAAVVLSYPVQFAWISLVILLVIILVTVFALKTLLAKGRIYTWLNARYPNASASFFKVLDADIDKRLVVNATISSLGIELCGILHVFFAMKALGFPASLFVASSAYVISVLIMVISPFLRGLGAVELMMVLALEKFSFTAAQALSITLIYRVFEFWIPLLAGLVAFAWKGTPLILRILSVVLSFLLGLVNIISAITPPILSRLHLLKEYLPLATIHASNLLVLLVGLSLLVTAAFLLKGLRTAWIMAFGFTLVSLTGHLTKALDFEEALFAGLTAFVLLLTVSQYQVRSSVKWMKVGFAFAATSFITVSLFAFISFYFIDIKHFGIDFTWRQSLVHTFKSFLLVKDETLHPVTSFGREFIGLIRLLGFLTWCFFILSIFQTSFNAESQRKATNKEKAHFLLQQFGNSSIDYFKVYKDKLLFFSDIYEAFIAYKISRGFAIVLEGPVCAEDDKVGVLQEFDQNCRKMGLKPAFYRVDENSVYWFNQLKKKSLMIGQEAILDITTFSLEGRDKKSLRNGLNSLEKKGFLTVFHKAPHSGEFVKRLKEVSDNWLAEYQKQEVVFSQGMFDEKELSQQDIITVENNDGQVFAFLNIIPDYADSECTYDLIRKTSDAPPAAMDALIVKLIEYAKERELLFLNLGLVPMTGLANPQNVAETIMNLIATRARRFQRYKGLREFKEKYASLWENKYLIYDNDFDLLQLPIALNAAMKV